MGTTLTQHRPPCARMRAIHARTQCMHAHTHTHTHTFLSSGCLANWLVVLREHRRSIHLRNGQGRHRTGRDQSHPPTTVHPTGEPAHHWLMSTFCRRSTPFSSLKAEDSDQATAEMRHVHKHTSPLISLLPFPLWSLPVAWGPVQPNFSSPSSSARAFEW